VIDCYCRLVCMKLVAWKLGSRGFMDFVHFRELQLLGFYLLFLRKFLFGYLISLDDCHFRHYLNFQNSQECSMKRD
jgi:hypothetical protein